MTVHVALSFGLNKSRGVGIVILNPEIKITKYYSFRFEKRREDRKIRRTRKYNTFNSLPTPPREREKE